MADEPKVNITLTDVYVKLCALEERVHDMTPQGQLIKDHESRLRQLERWRYALPTSLFLAVASVILAIVEAKP